MTLEKQIPEAETYEQICSRLFCRLINPVKNRKYLEDVPAEPWMDLSVICCLRQEPEKTELSVPVRKAGLKQWGISAQRLFRDAHANLAAEAGSALQKLSSLIPECCCTDAQDSPLYVLHYPDRPFGAVCITEPEILQKAAAVVGQEFFILPSSVHECLLLPDTGEYEVSRLNAMVKEINQTHLLPEEILSDHIYRYTARGRRIEIPVQERVRNT